VTPAQVVEPARVRSDRNEVVTPVRREPRDRAGVPRSIVLLVGIALGCGKGDTKSPPPPSVPEPVAAPATSAAVPDAHGPVLIVPPKEIDTTDPDTWTVQDYDTWTIRAPTRPSGEGVLDTANQYVFTDAMLVQDTRLPGQPTDLSWTLAQGADGAMPKRAKILSERIVTVAGIQGLDRTWKGKLPGVGSIKGRVRVFVRDGHMWQIEALYTEGMPAAAVDRFVESFAVTPLTP
jgi:hypothetical protein